MGIKILKRNRGIIYPATFKTGCGKYRSTTASCALKAQKKF
jgi:hypothetical protein